MSIVPFQDDQESRRQVWVSRLKSLTPTQKLIALGAICLLVSVLMVFGVTRKPAMKALTSGLSEEQTSQVVRKLEELKVDYQLQDSGAVLVPADQLKKIRLEMASSGLPGRQDLGFTLFDKVNLQMTDFSQRVTYLRALQGELQETISSVPGVESVRVHLNLPEDSLLSDDRKVPSASVMLGMREGASLNRNQCRGILRLVASSAEGLKTENVTLTDTEGRLLFDGEENLVHSEREEEVLALHLQRVAQSVVDRVAGPNRAVAAVRVELQKDRRKLEQTSVETDKSGQGYPKLRTTSQEEYQGTLKQGNNRVDSNVARAGNVTEAPLAGSERPSYKQNQQRVEYEFGRRVESVEENPSRIRRLTASVVVDGSTKLSKQQLLALRGAVALAVGVDEKRGDRCVVEQLPFYQAPKLPDDSLAAGGAKAAWKYALGALPLLLFGAWLWKGRRKTSTVQEPAEEAPLVLAGDSTSPAALESGSGIDITLPAESSPALALPSRAELKTLIEKARKIASEKPDLAAKLVQNWVSTERRK